MNCMQQIDNAIKTNLFSIFCSVHEHRTLEVFEKTATQNESYFFLTNTTTQFSRRYLT